MFPGLLNSGGRAEQVQVEQGVREYWDVSPGVVVALRVFVWGSLALVLVKFVIDGLAWWSSEFAVTDRRVLTKTGLIRRRTRELRLAKVESIELDQGVFGRLLGYGALVVTGTGGTRASFKRLPDPLELQQCVQEQVEALGAD